MIAETRLPAATGRGFVQDIVKAFSAARARRREYRRIHDELSQYSASELVELGLDPSDIRLLAEQAADRLEV
ncbi:hypothetical protein [Ostreiculturibacter nitratireducens]|uniref:hypothetical protein n=1 Tax=Ostreiculturibacter nitratireducens TaxID=3075226 RepID=UPI0031B5826D